MPKVIRELPQAIRFTCDDPSDTFKVSYTNMGEPFREGISIGIENEDFSKELTVMLGDGEAIRLRDFLNKMYPGTTSNRG